MANFKRLLRAQNRLTLVAKADARQLYHAIYANGPFRW